jgi:Helix-turn-helix domain of resolvase
LTVHPRFATFDTLVHLLSKTKEFAMAAKKDPSRQSLSVADKLERRLAKIQAAQRRKFINEDILRLEKNGDISYETVRTMTSPQAPPKMPQENHPPHAPEIPPTAETLVQEIPANSNLLPNKLPQTPALHDFGNLIDHSAASIPAASTADAEPQSPSATDLASNDTPPSVTDQRAPEAPISCHETQNSGNKTGEGARDPLDDLLHRAIAVAKVRRGRPPALDDQAKGQLIALLSVGMSIRQAAAILGVSHTTLQKALKADPSLNESITAARFQAQLQPLACVIREARRSWKAATWLLKYLDQKIASHEETPDERRERQHREAEEFFARSAVPGVKKRKILG